MLAVNRVLFPTDFSACSENAFMQAVFLARHFGAELHIVHARVGNKQAPVNLFVDFPLEESEIAEQLHMVYNRQRDQYRRVDDIPVVQAEVDAASAALAILEYETSHQIDLIVMGTHGRSGLDRLMIGSVAEEVVRLASCPVYTVHSAGTPQTVRPVQSLLVPVDFSESSGLLLAYARELALTYHARLDVLHVLENVGLPYVTGFEPLVIVPETESPVEQARQDLLSLLADTGTDVVPCEAHVRVGRPDHVIADFAADHRNDLIVIATHGWTGFRRLILGSVTEKVVRHANTPVFTVKSYGKMLVSGPSFERRLSSD